MLAQDEKTIAKESIKNGKKSLFIENSLSRSPGKPEGLPLTPEELSFSKQNRGLRLKPQLE